jgi:hypothetical protein
MGSTPGNTVPELVLGAGGKAPGFVQQMLFSAPVQEKNAKGMEEKKDRHECSSLLMGGVEHINQSINALLGGNSSTNSNATTGPSNPSLPPFKFH